MVIQRLRPRVGCGVRGRNVECRDAMAWRSARSAYAWKPEAAPVPLAVSLAFLRRTPYHPYMLSIRLAHLFTVLYSPFKLQYHRAPCSLPASRKSMMVPRSTAGRQGPPLTSIVCTAASSLCMCITYVAFGASHGNILLDIYEVHVMVGKHLMDVGN
ncbi:hypothetical protein EJ02DRAFT_52456 [Clathrospora elynae]|uniref:Uncharacterized protein n=1 Tax=Clathrospora elynae TaxID=706981 RepID=A0A6A5SXZ9_9PLEO|nr:hypothetical protein EJ02DRAFT_52456 [Clathrospora elynae]